VIRDRRLTARQNEVVELVATGLTNKQVADALFVCEKTVKFHLTRIYAATGVKGRTQLALLFADKTQVIVKEIIVEKYIPISDPGVVLPFGRKND
jgi:LuxR family transcriptional regulator, positive regulator of biofilm formation